MVKCFLLTYYIMFHSNVSNHICNLLSYKYDITRCRKKQGFPSY